MAYEASYLAPDYLTGFIFCCSPVALRISDLGGVKSFEYKNAMIQIHVYVKSCINIHEVFNSLPPNQGLKVRTYSYMKPL